MCVVCSYQAVNFSLEEALEGNVKTVPADAIDEVGERTGRSSGCGVCGGRSHVSLSVKYAQVRGLFDTTGG